MEGKIEDTVDLNLKYPSVSNRYWTKYYFIPKDRRRPGGGDGDVKEAMTEEGVEEGSEDVMKEKGKGGTEESDEVQERGETAGKMDVDDGTEREKRMTTTTSQNSSSSSPQHEGVAEHPRHPAGPDNSGHVCVMVHTNKLCLVTLSPRHPALAPGQRIAQVSYEVGKFNRMENQVSGKGKRGAQMMGPQSPVCIITCADGSRHTVLAGIHGKLVEVNERLLTNPGLLSEHPNAEGYLAVILPPLKNGDAPLRRLLTAEQYWAQER